LLRTVLKGLSFECHNECLFRKAWTHLDRKEPGPSFRKPDLKIPRLAGQQHYGCCCGDLSNAWIVAPLVTRLKKVRLRMMNCFALSHLEYLQVKRPRGEIRYFELATMIANPQKAAFNPLFDTMYELSAMEP